MASLCGGTACFQIPAINGGGILCNHTPLNTRRGCVTLSSSKLSSSFKCLAISSDSRIVIKEAVETEKAPAALGPYSQANKVNNILFVSGVLGLVPQTGKFISDNVEDQTEQVSDMSVSALRSIVLDYLLLPLLVDDAECVFVSVSLIRTDSLLLKNMGEILKAGGASYSSVVKTTIMLADLKDFKKVNEIYAKYFPSPFPARSTYQVAALPLDAKIEIECIATL
ncbi:ribonuclease UK114 [Trifolium pratense]|uniref:Ribonuclease UK114 n=1 Tax=Trifolium pratense TaxID=57577 RepID=A0A2K3N5V7_TRIPR|nr:ribonuclease UK114 [Trifolium pratense]